MGANACFESGVYSCEMTFVGEDIYACDPESGTRGELSNDCGDDQYCLPDENGEPVCSDLTYCFVICADECFENNPSDPELCVGTFFPRGSVTPLGILNHGDIEQYLNPEDYQESSFETSLDAHCQRLALDSGRIGSLSEASSIDCTPETVWAEVVSQTTCSDGSEGCYTYPDAIREILDE